MKRKMTTLFISMMIALSLVGAAYALWSEELLITGTIETGEVNVDLIAYECWDVEEKDEVSDIFCYLLDNTLFITITNAYPSIWYYCHFDIYNSGTIPVDLASIVIDRKNLPAGATFDTIGMPVLGYQLHPDNSLCVELGFHLANDAEELTQYTFSVTMDWWQYNEYPTLP